MDRDHPRICGEKGFIGLEVGLYPGSPPHMRGKAGINPTIGARPRITPAYAGKSLLIAIVFAPFNGITPAYAGKRYWRRCSCSALWDHPRICGEKYTSLQ